VEIIDLKTKKNENQNKNKINNKKKVGHVVDESSSGSASDSEFDHKVEVTESESEESAGELKLALEGIQNKKNNQKKGSRSSFNNDKGIKKNSLAVIGNDKQKKKMERRQSSQMDFSDNSDFEELTPKKGKQEKEEKKEEKEKETKFKVEVKPQFKKEEEEEEEQGLSRRSSFKGKGVIIKKNENEKVKVKFENAEIDDREELNEEGNRKRRVRAAANKANKIIKARDLQTMIKDEDDDDFEDQQHKKKSTEKAEIIKEKGKAKVNEENDDDFQILASATLVELKIESTKDQSTTKRKRLTASSSNGESSKDQSVSVKDDSGSEFEINKEEDVDDLFASGTSSEEEEEQPTIQRRTSSGSKRMTAKERTFMIHPELATVWDLLKKEAAIPVQMASQPEPLKLPLLPFQKEGLNWLLKQEETKFRGGILADEMGMGKTIQVISLLVSKKGKDPALVICPTVALIQWKNEIMAHTQDGALKVEIFYGQDRESNPENLKKVDVVLTTYSVVENGFRRQQYGFKRKGEKVFEPSVLHQVHWFRIILDEAHNIKDRSCSTARAVFALDSDFKWSLSGTPLQNRIGELYSLIRFLNVDPFSYYFCRKCPCKSLHWRFEKNQTCKDCGHKAMSHFCWWNSEILKPIQRYGPSADGKEAFQKLAILLRKMMLRRTKIERANDLGLPPRQVFIRRDYFNEEENDFYEALFSESKTQFYSYVEKNTVLNNYAHIFELLTRMRQAVNHPFLVTHKRGTESEKNNVNVCGICQDVPEDPIIASCKHVFCREDVRLYINSCMNNKVECPICFRPLTIDLNQSAYEPAKSAIQGRQSILSRIDLDKWRSSTKIEALLEELTILTEKDELTKSVVFSQFVNFLDIIEWRLQKAGFRCVKLDGRMTPAQRDSMINAFMTMPQITVFLVSLKAGGVAINLAAAANHCFLMDPWWNPAVESQAMDRIHRLGQYRPVKVTRIIVENSIESRILQLQEKKELMFESTVGMDESALSKLTVEDLRFLFVM